MSVRDHSEQNTNYLAFDVHPNNTLITDKCDRDINNNITNALSSP